MLFIRKQFFMYFIYHLLTLLIKLKLRQFDSILDDTRRDGLFRPAPYTWTHPRPDCQVLDTPYLTSTNWQGAKLTYSKTYLKLTLNKWNGIKIIFGQLFCLCLNCIKNI